MKSLFFNLSVSLNVISLSTDYGGKYKVVYTFRDPANIILASSLNASGIRVLK